MSPTGRPPTKRRMFSSDVPRTRKGVIRLPSVSVGPVRAGHPLVYKEALQGGSQPVQANSGDVVELVDADGSYVGRGVYDEEGGIAVRVYTRSRSEVVDEALFKRRVESACALRNQFLLPTSPNLSAFRVVHAEGDFLPGITVDRYGDYLLVHLFTQSLSRFLPVILDTLEACWQPRGIYLQRRTRPQTGEGVRDGAELVRGQAAPIEIEVQEGDLRFAVDVTAPLGTGLFLDFREGRRRIADHAAGKHVLNLFSYAGSISVYAAQAGAAHVTSVDLSAKAHARARQNFERNGIDPEAHSFVAGDVFSVLTRMKSQGKQFDVVVVDPPPFSQSHGRTFSVHKDFGELVGHALEVCTTPGWLFCGTNALKISLPEIEIEIAKAGIYARKTVQIIQHIGLPSDFPLAPAYPEGNYLKWALCAVR